MCQRLYTGRFSLIVLWSKGSVPNSGNGNSTKNVSTFSMRWSGGILIQPLQGVIYA